MYHRVRRKMYWYYTLIAILILHFGKITQAKSLNLTEQNISQKRDDDLFDNNILDFDSEYNRKINKQFGSVPWNSNDNNFSKDSNRYTLIKDNINEFEIDVELNNAKNVVKTTRESEKDISYITEEPSSAETTMTTDYSVIPLELISTTENVLVSIIESTAEPDLTVIPLSTTQKIRHYVEIIDTNVTLPTSTENNIMPTEIIPDTTITTVTENTSENIEHYKNNSTLSISSKIDIDEFDDSNLKVVKKDTVIETNSNDTETMTFKTSKFKDLNLTDNTEIINQSDTITDSREEDVPIFTELDTEPGDVPEDYYDSKDIVPTSAPNNDALSVIFGLAGSVVESVAERVVPKGIFDLFKRMQKQNEALEAERLRSREENGGLGQFTRGLLKSISSGLSRPFNQLMAGVKDIGSLDNDRGFVSSVASGVTSVANVANSVVDSFKNRVQAIYPGTVWCGDGHSAQARSSELGLFFFTDTCCRQHDACKIFILAGETKYGLTNTGLFTRSHCSCDAKFRECLQKTGSLVSAQIGLTYFNVLGPQCFRRAHPIVRCMRRTRLTGQKCEEYELDFTKPKMWQWFDNETY